nr:UDP-N-acetylmuramoyl-tripeptide--D-alanyl-D-alanine ligase [Anaerotalea alkaliphila]
MAVSEVLAAVEGELLHGDRLRSDVVEGVSTDSRRTVAGDLYIPLVGNRFDGHAFLPQAFAGGAVLAFAQRVEAGMEELPLVLVDDTRLAMGRLAAHYRRVLGIPVIGVTGSVGKTSTKEMIASILGRRFQVHKTGGNFNNDVGVPLTLFGMEESHEMAVVEMGMNHFGEISYLSRMAAPDLAVVTNIGFSHVENLGSQRGILQAKMEILDGLQEGGVVVANGDDPLLSEFIRAFRNSENPKGIRFLTYGSCQGCDCRLLSYESHGLEGQEAVAETRSGRYQLRVPYPGRHMLFNALAGILVGERMGVEKEEIVEGIHSYRSEKMRLQVETLENGTLLIDDTYNASVDSMKSALDTLVDLSLPGQRKVAVLGSMFEMGGFSEEGHRQVGALASQRNLDLLLCIGEEARDIAVAALEGGSLPEDAVFWYGTQEEFLQEGLGRIRSGDAVLVKASRGMALEKTVEAVKSVR